MVDDKKSKANFANRLSYIARNPISGLSHGLWGGGTMPLRWKMLLGIQSAIFSFAIFVRFKDIERAKALDQFAEEQKVKGAAAAGKGSEEPPAGGQTR